MPKKENNNAGSLNTGADGTAVVNHEQPLDAQYGQQFMQNLSTYLANLRKILPDYQDYPLLASLMAMAILETLPDAVAALLIEEKTGQMDTHAALSEKLGIPGTAIAVLLPFAMFIQWYRNGYRAKYPEPEHNTQGSVSWLASMFFLMAIIPEAIVKGWLTANAAYEGTSMEYPMDLLTIALNVLNNILTSPAIWVTFAKDWNLSAQHLQPFFRSFFNEKTFPTIFKLFETAAPIFMGGMYAYFTKGMIQQFLGDVLSRGEVKALGYTLGTFAYVASAQEVKRFDVSQLGKVKEMLEKAWQAAKEVLPTVTTANETNEGLNNNRSIATLLYDCLTSLKSALNHNVLMPVYNSDMSTALSHYSKDITAYNMHINLQEINSVDKAAYLAFYLLGRGIYKFLTGEGLLDTAEMVAQRYNYSPENISRIKTNLIVAGYFLAFFSIVVEAINTYLYSKNGQALLLNYYAGEAETAAIGKNPFAIAAEILVGIACAFPQAYSKWNYLNDGIEKERLTQAPSGSVDSAVNTVAATNQDSTHVVVDNPIGVVKHGCNNNSSGGNS